MNLFEKLNRLDDSLVESRRVVKKKKLTESIEDVSRRAKFLKEVFTKWEIIDLAQAHTDFTGRTYKEAFNYVLNNWDNFYFEDEYEAFCEDELDNDIDEKLTEGYSNEMTEFMNWIQEYRNGALWDAFTTEFESEQDPDISVVLTWLENFDEDGYYDYIAADTYDDNVDEILTENRNNPYFTPYGYRDAAKVLNGKAPEYYYHLKHIEMDTGDGIKLARYALKKGLPVMVDKNSDPDYPEFAIKGKYHWDDYFYSYPTAHEEDLVAWDGKMFVEESLVEGASEVYYLELFSNDGKTFEQSFSTYREAEEEGNFSLENNPMTKEYIIYDKNHKRVKHKR